MCTSGALIHPAALTEGGRDAGRQAGGSGRSYAAFSEKYPRTAGRVCAGEWRHVSGWTRSCALQRRCSTPPGTGWKLVSPNKVKGSWSRGSFRRIRCEFLVIIIIFSSGVDRVCLFPLVASVRLSDANSGSAALHTRAQTLTLLRCVLLPVPRE